MIGGIEGRNDHASDHVAFSEWRPEVFVSDGVREVEALTARLRNSVSEFCRKEIGMQRILVASETDQPVTSVAAMIEGFEGEVVCAAPTPDLAAICAAAMGMEPGPYRSGHSGQILQLLVDGVVGSLLDVFCKVIAAPGPSSAIRRPVKSEEGQGIRALPKDIARLPISIDECGLRLEYLLEPADLRSLCQALGGEREAVSSADAAEEIPIRLMEAKVTLQGALLDRKATLGETRSWRVGSKVKLSSTPRSNVLLGVGGETLFRCELSRDGDFLAVRLLDASEGER
ncbi:MAG: FliM/FliN family flagellar motor C-terminal domain-containing protein [Rhodoblastus sp.]